jgi:hypothetical protein
MSRLFEDPAFVKQVAQRFSHFKSNEAALIDYIGSNAAGLKWSALENNHKWETLVPGIWPNENINVAYNDEVIKLKTWFQARMAWLDSEFALLR